MPAATTTRVDVPSEEFSRYAERIHHVMGLTSRLNVLPFEDETGRAALLAEIFGRPLPPSVRIYPPFYSDYGLNIELGEDTFVNQGCTFGGYGGVQIGARVMIGFATNLISSGHPVPRAERREHLTASAITIEDDVWLGACVTVLPGVTIGEGAVVGAGAIVTKDVAADTLVTGPAATPRRALGG